MADAGFFKGTSAEQDSRFANKQKKLLKQMKFPDNIAVKVDMSKVNLDVMKPWITKRLHELLGIEDDVVIEFVFNQLDEKHPDPKMMQINLTGFLGGSKARLFIGELWQFLASAQTSPDGMPAELVELKRQELLKRQQEDDRLREIRKREEETYRAEIKPDPESNGRHGRYVNDHVSDHRSRNNHQRERRASPKPVKQRPERKSSPAPPPPPSAPEPKKSRASDRHVSLSSSSSSPDTRSPQRQAKSPVKHSHDVSNAVKRHRHNDHVTNEKPSRKRQSPPPKPSTRKASPVQEKTSSKSNKSRKHAKRTRSSSRSSSSSSSASSTSKKDRKHKKKVPPVKRSSPSRSRSPVAQHRNKKSDKKKDDRKSKKHSTNNSKSSSSAGKKHEQQHHRGRDRKRSSHRNRSISRTSDHHEVAPVVDASSPSPKKPRLQSEIKVQTPPRSTKAREETKSRREMPEPPSTTIKTYRTERIVVLEDTEANERVPDSMPNKSTHDSSEDENEIDLRERLLREKAIKSMRNRRQLSQQDELQTTSSNDRIVFQT